MSPVGAILEASGLILQVRTQKFHLFNQRRTKVSVLGIYLLHPGVRNLVLRSRLSSLFAALSYTLPDRVEVAAPGWGERALQKGMQLQNAGF